MNDDMGRIVKNEGINQQMWRATLKKHRLLPFWNEKKIESLAYKKPNKNNAPNNDAAKHGNNLR